MAKQTFHAVPLAAMQTAMGNSGFSNFVAGELGNTGTNADGFDSVLLDIAAAVAAEQAAAPYLNALVSLADFSTDPPDSPSWGNAVSQFASLSAAGDNVLNSTLGVLAASGGPPPAPPALTPLPAPVVTPPVHTAPPPTTPPVHIWIPGIPTGPVWPPEYCKTFNDDIELCPKEQ